jgi:hypothetical protein
MKRTGGMEVKLHALLSRYQTQEMMSIKLYIPRRGIQYPLQVGWNYIQPEWTRKWQEKFQPRPGTEAKSCSSYPVNRMRLIQEY